MGQTIVLDVDKATLSGVTRERSDDGVGFVTGFDRDGDRVSWRFSALAGLYGVRVRFRTPSGEKGFGLTIDGKARTGHFAASAGFSWADGGRVLLGGGAHTLSVEKGWGYFDIASVELAPSGPIVGLKPLPAVPVDARATPEARGLLNTLAKSYGRETWSGQYDEAEVSFVRTATGVTPKVLGFDLIEYSPSRREHGADPKDITKRAVGWAKGGYTLTVSWHWNAPMGLLDKEIVGADGKTIDARWYKGFYSNATTYDIRRAVTPGTEENRLALRDIDAIAAALKPLADARVPVLWRPLHEAEGGWFWWGTHGPEPFIKLWRLMYGRLTGMHGLHNLLWVFTAGEKAGWYPGGDVVDVVGADVYTTPDDPMSGIWENLAGRFDGRKLIALSECGGVPDVGMMRAYGVRWSYFVSWTGDLGPRRVPAAELARRYRAKGVRNR